MGTPVEVAGIVFDINYTARWLKLTIPKTKETAKCTWKDFYYKSKRIDFKVKRGDAIAGRFIKDSDGDYFIKEFPFVELAVDPKSVISTISTKMTGKDYKKALAVFNKLADEAGGENKVVFHLTQLASEWEKRRDEGYLDTVLAGEKNFTAFLTFWYQNINVRRILCLGVTEDLIRESLLSPDELYPKLIKNPYTVACVPLELCTSIKKQVGIKLGNEEVEKGVIVRIVYDAMKNRGWVCTPVSYLNRKHQGWEKYTESLDKDYDLVVSDQYESVYLKMPLRIEEFVAEKIAKLVESDKITYDTPVVPSRKFGYGDLRCSVELSKEFAIDQVNAIQGGVDHTFCIITGGAGTGKTSCLAEIVYNLENRGIQYALCSFTGKAVARIKEVVGPRINSYTIHRLIEMAKKKDFESRVEHLIIDEASMVTTLLFYNLFTVYTNIKKVTLIGDVNQLRPIEWGSLFSEVLSSYCVPVYRLTTNYRIYIENGEKNGIILNANNLLEHDEGPFEYIETNNFMIMEGGPKLVMEMVNIMAKNGIPAKNVVTICPYKVENGDGELNQISNHYQKTYDKGEVFHIDERGVKWREGDVVMLKKNNSDIGVFNGEMGIVREIRKKEMIVDFGSAGAHEFLYEPTTIKRGNYEDENDIFSERTVRSLDHGYVMTINKAQGSEWDFVIIYVPHICQGDFINRNLIYTAITRAKRAVYLITKNLGKLEEHSVKSPNLREEKLSYRLSGLLPGMDEYRNKERYTNAYMHS